MERSAVEGVITDAQLDTFEQKGYMVIEDPCPPELIDAVAEDVEPLYHRDFGEVQELDYVSDDDLRFSRHAGQSLETYQWQRVARAWKVCDSVRAMALSPRVLAITEALFGRKPCPFNTLNFPLGTQQPAHFDSMAFQSDPPNFMCGVWVALEDMDMDNGPLIYYPGSHKLRPTWDDIEEVTGERINRDDHDTRESFLAARNEQYASYCRLVVERNGFEPEYGLIKKGQALLWAPNLLHGGAPQRDPSRTRHSQVTHYMFEGCRHYTPQIAEPDHIYWLYPMWVSDPPPNDSTASIHAAIEKHVPAGETVLIAGEGYEGILDVPGRNARHFPQTDDGTLLACAAAGDGAVEHLERMRSEGASYIVFPKRVLTWLIGNRELQGRLEMEYRGLMRDGNVCAIYELR
jgi:ectoine hydroxylase-related dioxygenase (phytanoyl-CoA dioxygenase family)